MESLKKPEMIMSTIALLGTAANALYSYKQFSSLKADIINIGQGMAILQANLGQGFAELPKLVINAKNAAEKVEKIEKEMKAFRKEFRAAMSLVKELLRQQVEILKQQHDAGADDAKMKKVKKNLVKLEGAVEGAFEKKGKSKKKEKDESSDEESSDSDNDEDPLQRKKKK